MTIQEVIAINAKEKAEQKKWIEDRQLDIEKKLAKIDQMKKDIEAKRLKKEAVS